MAILKYHLTFHADIDRLSEVIDFIRGVGSNNSFGKKFISNLELVMYEACANIVEHAYEFDKRKIIKILVFYDHIKLIILVNDYGKSFKIEDIPKVDIDEVVEKGQTRGLGYHVISKVMDKVEYKSTKRFGNILKMVKKIKDGDVINES